ncbi:arginase [Intestinibacter sp.]|uniref:arginase n=1 Tax=Intestinibacter sp. TaxID=1965304 RepID=UPI002A7604C1|nr:arginase [Intestinibacter sp.]MDY2735330.1 arginase [Intestinibacter sp.]MDY4575433.1 arginase [Intestinibacter sp.]
MSSLITIDWDYFMNYMSTWNGSYIENETNIYKHWYKKYFEEKNRGIDITKHMNVGGEVDEFWAKLKKNVNFKPNTKILLTESHLNAYKIAVEQGVDSVFSFDSHSDLGYEGLDSFKFEVNCADWLGKLIYEGKINQANIIYGPYTNEYPEEFDEINKKYDVNYLTLEQVKCDDPCEIVHICRSGCWSAPWLDKRFLAFVYESGFEFENIDIKEREWDPNGISLAEQIDYMLYG